MKKNIKRLIILLGIVLIICIIILNFNPKVKAQKELKEIQISDYMDGNLILPQGLYKLGAKYKGELTTEIICKTYNNFAENLIPKYYCECKNLSNEELKQYFLKNREIVNIELGYDNIEEFEKFVNKIKTLNGEKLSFSSYRVIGESIENLSKYTIAYLGITYEDNEEIIFNTKVLNQLSTVSTSILYYADIDEKIIEQDKIVLEEENNTMNETTNIEVPKSGKVYE